MAIPFDLFFTGQAAKRSSPVVLFFPIAETFNVVHSLHRHQTYVLSSLDRLDSQSDFSHETRNQSKAALSRTLELPEPGEYNDCLASPLL